MDHPGSYWIGWFIGPYIGVPAAHDDFRALGVFSDIQWVPLTDDTVVMTGPAGGSC